MSYRFQSTQMTDTFSMIVPVTVENPLAMIQNFEGIYLVAVKVEKMPYVFVIKFRIRETFKKTMYLKHKNGLL